MPVFQAPLRDVQFVWQEVLGTFEHYKALPHYAEVEQDLVNAVFEEGAKFCEKQLLPLFQVGDKGCDFNDGQVTAPPGFKEAYLKYVEGGWPGLDRSCDYGGQGLPPSLGLAVNEFVCTSNWAWGMYPLLSHGAISTIESHGTDLQKEQFLPNLVSGEWTGTMCLTESHCGTDLGLLRTKAEPQADGSYKISGSKIFISGGEQDMTDNIIHIVLARLPDSPAGTKGISLFIVPRQEMMADGSLGDNNNVTCGSIEHKMGIRGCPACVMNFDGATGYLLGEPNRGLHAMFTFMNDARLGTAQQGTGHAEFAYQNAYAYAQDRLQMRSLSGVKAPEKAADPIIVHPDVRRMLLTAKSFAEGGRMLNHYLGQKLDVVHASDDADERSAADAELSLLTPIAKAFLTEAGLESASHGIQCLGGHGYIAEWGLEQNYRDARISTLYEGTTGIQALDLLARKVLGSGGSLLEAFLDKVDAYVDGPFAGDALSDYQKQLQLRLKQWREITKDIADRARQNPDEIGAATVDYLMFSGYVVLGYFWLRAADAAYKALAEGAQDKDFYEAKLRTARFYFERMLPRVESHRITIYSGCDNLLVDGNVSFSL